jgi:hypothetical protein
MLQRSKKVRFFKERPTIQIKKITTPFPISQQEWGSKK